MLIFVDVSSTNFYGSKAVCICLLVFVLLSRASRVATHLYIVDLKPFTVWHERILERQSKIFYYEFYI